MKTCIISCETMRRELEQGCAACAVPYPVFWIDASLHNQPEQLLPAMQACVDQADSYERILFATGFCGSALCGLQARAAELIIPRTDDCISLLLGSHARRRALSTDGGIYFLTDGWLKSDRSIIAEYGHACRRYGPDRAKKVFRSMFAHYTRLAVIETGAYDPEPVFAAATQLTEPLHLKCESIPADNTLLHALLTGPWPEAQFLTLPPGRQITRADLRPLY